MLTDFKIPQLRILVNSRCGRACFYCRPSGEAISTASKAQLSPEAVLAVCDAYIAAGGSHIKISGGDPVLWDPLVSCVTTLRKKSRTIQIEVISRHPRIGELAAQLARAGVDIFNLSIDTLDPATHKLITGIDDLPAVLSAVDSCVATSIPVKLNMVVMAGINSHEIDKIIQHCEIKGVHTLKLLDVIKDLEHGTESYSGRLRREFNLSPADLYVDLSHVADQIKTFAVQTKILTQGSFGHPMLNMTLGSGLNVVLKDHQKGAWYGDICKDCKHFPCHDALMALRLTADERLQFCLLREDCTVKLSRDPSEIKEQVLSALSQYLSAQFTLPSQPNTSKRRALQIIGLEPQETTN